MGDPLTGVTQAADSLAAPPPDPDFQRRLDQQSGRLRRALMRVYGERSEFEVILARIHDLLARRRRDRPSGLKRLDQARELDPDWFLRGDRLGYSTYVPQFAGSLAGVRATIPYLRDLGVTYLHLLPVLKPRAGDSDGGFAVADFEAVDPRLGDMADLESLARDLRGQGISTCIDLVLNHVADDHPWSKAAKAGDPYYRGFFRIIHDADEVAAYEASLEQIFPVSAPGNFTPVDQVDGWVWTTFYPYQWDLNYSNPEVFLAILDALLGLAAQGVDVFRLDSVAYIWKQMGTACRNLPQAHALIEALRAADAIAAPAVILKSEA
ncbi:MAG: alpha-amylase family glycosyl hydrolase, partial [Caulobacteraceae bacterium]|nr:alpha-amylase family glycosyl hydrolase [Caulobacteraceae bacterium]